MPPLIYGRQEQHHEFGQLSQGSQEPTASPWEIQDAFWIQLRGAGPRDPHRRGAAIRPQRHTSGVVHHGQAIT